MAPHRPTTTQSHAPTTRRRPGPATAARLPDGPWRRKRAPGPPSPLPSRTRQKLTRVPLRPRLVVREREQQTTVHKVRQAYARLLAANSSLHPDRRAMLDEPATPALAPVPAPATAPEKEDREQGETAEAATPQRRTSKSRKLSRAERVRAEREAARVRAAEDAVARHARLEDRKRRRAATAWALRTAPTCHGRQNAARKLGRESTILLDKVQRMLARS